VPISVIKARQNKIVKFRATLAKKPHSDKPTGKYPLWTSMTKYAYTRAMSRAECMLVSARGLNWKTVFLVMFTVYVDDSGTDPNQKLAVATALIIPAKQIPAMEIEWSNLKTKEHFSRFHMAEFVARNPKSEFANWDDKKHQRVFDRVRQITNKYGVRGFSFTVNKRD
jgi:hypothetical protein